MVGNVLDRGQLVVVRQDGGPAQMRQTANLGGPPFVTVNPAVAERCVGDVGSQFIHERVRAIQHSHCRPFRAPTGFRLIIENMAHGSTAHEVLAVVFQVRGVGMSRGAAKPQLNVLLWQRAKEPQRGAWSLPGGRLRNDEDMTSSVRRQLAEKVDLRELAHLEQLAVFSDPHRLPGIRMIASTYLGVVPLPATPSCQQTPAGTR